MPKITKCKLCMIGMAIGIGILVLIPILHLVEYRPY